MQSILEMNLGSDVKLEPFLDSVQCIVCKFYFRQGQDTTATCCPDHFMCQECLQGYMVSKIMEGICLNIRCPMNSKITAENCQFIFSQQQVCQVIESCNINGLEQKFHRFLFAQKVDLNPNIRWCPNCTKRAGINEADSEGSAVSVYSHVPPENQVIYMDGYMV